MKVAMEVLESGFKETEIGLIPEDWEVVRLGEVVEKIKAGGTPKRSEKRFWGGSIPFILIEDLTKNNLYIKDAREYITEEGLEKSNAWIVPANSLLLSMYATIGETAINLIPVATNQAILGIIPKRDRLNVEFGAYLLKFHSKRLLSQNIQTTQKNVNKGIVENFLIPLPPLEEQRAIADILSTVQNVIEKTEKVINATKQFKKSMMKHLFTYGAVAIDEIDKVILKESEIGLIPEHWEVVRLENAMKGFTPNKKLKQSDYKAIGKFPVIDQGQEYIAGFYDDETMVFDKDLPVILFGDHTRIIKYVDFPFICGADGLKIIIPKENFHRKYFYYALLNLNIPSRGYNRHFKILKEKLIPLPPLEEQQKIAQILTTLDQKIQVEGKKKEALQNLFKTLLKQLMTGKIRVKKSKT
jgi:type I restriction enzyme S subunit